MKTAHFCLLILIFFAFSCNSKSDKNTNNQDSTDANIEVIETSEKYLSIEGNDIWIRSQPTTGEVVMKLNDGNKCKILEKGKEETIKGNSDFWYKIEFEGKEGWVFGSQTSIKQNKSNSNVEKSDNEEIEDFVTNITKALKNNNSIELNNLFYLENQVFFISNPGVYNVIYLVEQFDINEHFSYFTLTNSDVKFEQWPQFDMETYDWEKNGIFVEKYSEKYFEELVDLMDEFGFESTEEEKKYSKELDKVTEYKIIFTEAFLRLYIAKKDGKWRITAIDIHDFSA